MRGLSRFAAGLIAFSVITMGLAAGTQRAWAAPVIDSSVDPTSKDISCGGNPLGTITITEYHADNPGDGSVGASMGATFTPSDPDCNLQLHWIQAIVGGVGTIGQSDVNRVTPGDPSPIPYLDPYHRDDNLPFYWTEPENGTVGVGRANAGAQAGTLFSDGPSQDDRNIGNSIHFETALVAVDCKDPMKLYWLAGFTWGYSISATNIPNPPGMSTIDPFAWLNGASANMNTAVTGFDGTENYVGDANDTMQNNAGGGIGYNFAAGCPTCCCSAVPLPSAAWASSAGLAALGFIAGIRARHLKASRAN